MKMTFPKDFVSEHKNNTNKKRKFINIDQSNNENTDPYLLKKIEL